MHLLMPVFVLALPHYVDWYFFSLKCGERETERENYWITLECLNENGNIWNSEKTLVCLFFAGQNGASLYVNQSVNQPSFSNPASQASCQSVSTTHYRPSNGILESEPQASVWISTGSSVHIQRRLDGPGSSRDRCRHRPLPGRRKPQCEFLWLQITVFRRGLGSPCASDCTESKEKHSKGCQEYCLHHLPPVPFTGCCVLSVGGLTSQHQVLPDPLTLFLGCLFPHVSHVSHCKNNDG